jgi:splicing suppressor protein 51
MAENVNAIQDSAKKCGKCGKNESQLVNPLKHCAKCGQGFYCSRDCQKADWKNHKKVCGKQSTAGQSSSNDLVATFNALPRKQLSPSGSVRNHWHFSIRHVSMRPAGDLLFIINPEARYIHTEGPAQLLPLSTAAERAALVVPMLMKAFTSGMAAGLVPAPPLEAPWSWSTNDAELAAAVEARLKEVGVREELRAVQVGNDEEDGISDEEWPNLLGRLQDAAASTHTAGQTSSGRRAPTMAPGSNPDSNSGNTFHRLSEGTYLHGMSEQDAYCALIDSYRLRVEDEFIFSNVKKEFSKYSNNPQPLQGFQRYLDRVEAKARLLPPWWSVEKRRACEVLAQNRSQWSCIFFSAKKSDIVEFYKDSMKPMQLRIFAEEVEGWNVSGQGASSGANIAAMLGQMGVRG